MRKLIVMFCATVGAFLLTQYLFPASQRTVLTFAGIGVTWAGVVALVVLYFAAHSRSK